MIPMDSLRRDIRFLKLYAVAMTAFCAVILLTGFTRREPTQAFTEIDVERINIVEADGTLRMVISNQERQHPGIVNGKVIERSGPRPPGMIFFNHLGDEMGGLVFGENGDVGHFGSLTWDKVRGDQTIGFRYLEGDNGAYSAALEMWQQPNIPSDVMMAKYDSARALSDPAARDAAIQAMRDAGELTTRRLYFGKGRNDAMILDMRDAQGRSRIRMSVAPDGTPLLEFLDGAGDVVYRLPEG
jgi:hypothetical protein